MSFNQLPNLTNQISRKDPFPQEGGAFGTVWRCVLRTESTEIEVAVKTISVSRIHWAFIRICWSSSSRDLSHPPSRPSASEIVDCLKNAQNVWHRSDSNLRSIAGSVIRRISARVTSSGFRRPAESGSNSAPPYGGASNQNSDVQNVNEYSVVSRDIGTSGQSSQAGVDTTTQASADTNSQAGPDMSSQSGPDMSTSASANMSTQADSDMSMGLVLKNIQDFMGDLVNQIERLHEFPVSSGNYGEIWQCQLRVESEKVQVAVKSMRLPNVSQPRIRQMLLKEYYVWLKLKHTNIVRFYGMTSTFCVHPAMVTAWMRNGTLTEYLAQQYSYLKPRDRFCLINDVASGLCYLHSNNIIHGDLTGSSVFIDESGRACLADYGLAFINGFSAMNMTASTTDTHRGPNAARWTAPELVLEDSDSFVRPTMSSDIYSFGCIMLQILVGQLPYWWARSSTQVILAMAHKMLPIRDDPNVPRLHEHHVLFLKRCWGPDPHSRPSSADAAKFVAAELRKFREP